MVSYKTESASCLMALSLYLGLAGCSLVASDENKGPPPPPPNKEIAAAAAPEPLSTPVPEAEPRVEIYPGSGALVGQPNARRPRGETADGDITLNFVAADIRDVAKTVLGDYLKLNYEIAANVQGSVTIQTSRPLQKSQVLPLLEQALQLNGMALIHSNGIYKVMPLSDAKGASGALSIHEYRAPGYGIEIAPVRYISAEAMQKLLEPLAPSKAVIHVDSTRNVLVIEGTEQERRVILDDIALFDTDWLEGMSYALYTPNYIDAQELTRELNQVLGGLNSPVSGIVKLIPIDRLNTVLAISPQTKYLEQLRTWVRRLDRPSEGSDRRLFVYHVQNGRATDLATTLAKLMRGGAGSPLAGNATPKSSSANPNAIPPGSSDMVSASAGGVSAMNLGAGASGGITADEVNNALVFLATPQEHSAIEAALRKLDAPPLQVYIHAAIAEVTLSNQLQFGVQYFYNPGGGHQLTLSSTKSGTITSAFPGFSYAFTRGTNIQAILDTLSSVTTIEVTSSPEVLVLNNQTASLQVGDRVPVATAQAVGVTTANSAILNTIQYQDTGVVLKVTPRVNHGGLVMMDIQQEVSQVTTTTTSNIDSPTIQQRKIETSIAIQDGQTIALGGLITDRRSHGKTGLPYLQEIPLLGSIFGDRLDKKDRTELVVLITPHVVENMDQAKAVTDELRRRLPEVQPLLERLSKGRN